MAVTKVIEDGTSRSVHEEVVLEANQVPKIMMDTLRVFTVEFDTADNPLNRPFLARNATDGTTTVPAMWDSHPYDDYLFVKAKDVKTLGACLYEVTCKYDCQVNSVPGEEQLPLSPLMVPPEISFSSAGSNDPIDTDAEGLPIVNSAGESFDPQVTDDHNDTILRITRNEATYDEVTAAAFRDAVNNDIFLGFPVGHVKCTSITSDQMRAADLIYYRVRYEFRIRYSEVKTRDANGDVQTQVFGWVLRVRDEGYRELDGENADGSPKYKEITDENGVKISQPHLLDGSGKKLADDVIQNPPLPETCFLKFDVAKKRAFSALSL